MSLQETGISHKPKINLKINAQSQNIQSLSTMKFLFSRIAITSSNHSALCGCAASPCFSVTTKRPSLSGGPSPLNDLVLNEEPHDSDEKNNNQPAGLRYAFLFLLFLLAAPCPSSRYSFVILALFRVRAWSSRRRTCGR